MIKPCPRCGEQPEPLPNEPRMVRCVNSRCHSEGIILYVSEWNDQLGVDKAVREALDAVIELIPPLCEDCVGDLPLCSTCTNQIAAIKALRPEVSDV